MKSNVFIGQTCNLLSNFVFTLILPGCKASVRKKRNGEYYLFHLELDVEYGELVAQSKKPGLYGATKNKDEWSLVSRPNGELKKIDDRIVVISDGHKTPEFAALQAATHIAESSIGGDERLLTKYGFDLQYHYGKKIGGLTQIAVARNPQSEASLRENALLLAGTMGRAIKTNGVAWISERGGSGVLTQAMHILKERGITFKDSEHYVYFSHPTTNLDRAEWLARDLGLNFARASHASDKLNLDELVGGLNFAGDMLSAYHRFRCDENYSVVKMSVDMAKGTGASWKAVTTLAASTAAVSAAVGLGGGAVAMPATIAVASAVGGIGKTLFKAWLPQRYRAIITKL